jgi:methyl-CpG-binding domain protein 4
MVTWIPPESPYDLLQERFWPDEWKILVVCLMLNQTSRKQVEPMISNFFEVFPTPEFVVEASTKEMIEMLRPLGLVNRRVNALKRFSEEFLSKKWDQAIELFGCGKYANDAYKIFVKGQWKDTHPSDHALNDYHGWLQKWNTRYNTINSKEA